MIFNSVTYLLFLALVVMLYWRLPDRPRLWLVFAASLTFYGFWRLEFLPLLLVSTATDYLISRRIYASDDPGRKKHLLWVSLLVNLGLLFYFKYLIFFADNAVGLMHLLGVEADPLVLNILLPLGISFYTFQTISYTVDVYRGLIRPEKNFVLYGCYVTFFPQLVAGPILRAVEVLPQLRHRPGWDWHDGAIGIRRILYGLFLKVVLADNIAPLVDAGFATEAGLLSALDTWTLAFLFGFQIYFDFSAYSHIAIGSARLMGIQFPENFSFPYLATSPRDFWRRWHISLSSWIRDYLYLPLTGARFEDRSEGGLESAVTGGDRRGRNRALFLSWAIMGLWHGANWTFVMWGLYHAAVIYLFRLVSGAGKTAKAAASGFIGWAITLPVMMLGWLPFRAESIGDTLTLYGKILTPGAYLWLGLRENTYLITALLLGCMVAVYWARPLFADRPKTAVPRLSARRMLAETAAFAIIIPLVFVFLRPIKQFIYFQF
ncbi:MAG: MBOAT family O-acyltransferase [Leptospirillia bacterium]